MSLSAETLSAVLRGAGKEKVAWTGFLEPGLLLSPLTYGQPDVLRPLGGPLSSSLC